MVRSAVKNRDLWSQKSRLHVVIVNVLNIRHVWYTMPSIPLSTILVHSQVYSRVHVQVLQSVVCEVPCGLNRKLDGSGVRYGKGVQHGNRGRDGNGVQYGTVRNAFVLSYNFVIAQQVGLKKEERLIRTNQRNADVSRMPRHFGSPLWLVSTGNCSPVYEKHTAALHWSRNIGCMETICCAVFTWLLAW